MVIGAKIIFLLLGILGFLLAVFVRREKKQRGTVLCPLVGDCGAVLHSKYGTFLGLDTTTWGAFYYALIIVFSILTIMLPALGTPVTFFLLIVATLFAFLFSLYLFGIQIFIIKHWCSWCLASGVLNLILFILAVTAPDLTTFVLLGNLIHVLVVIFGIALAVGVGAVTISDIFLFRFLRDYRISEKEASVIHIITDVVWGALGLLLASGIGLIIASHGGILLHSQSLMMVLIAGMILVISLLLHRLWFHRVVDISFGDRTVEYKGQLHDLRRLIYAFAITSLVSWYSMLILTLVKIRIGFGWLFLGYFLLVILGVVISQYVDWKFIQKRYHSS